MATEDEAPVDPDQFVEPSVEETSHDDPLDLEPGEEYIGRITDYRPWAGDNGVLEIDGEDLFLNRTMQKQLIAGLVSGKDVLFEKAEHTESFENDDGETVEYNPRNLRFMED